MNLDMTLHDSAMLRSAIGGAAASAAGTGHSMSKLASPHRARRGARPVCPATSQHADLGRRLAGGDAARHAVDVLDHRAFGGVDGVRAIRIGAARTDRAYRLAARNRHTLGDSVRFAAMILLNKFAHVCGQAWYVRDRMIGARLPAHRIQASRDAKWGRSPFATGGNVVMRCLFGPEFAADLERYPRGPFGASNRCGR